MECCVKSSQCSVRPELVSSGIPLTSLRQSQPSMRFECVVVVVAASPRYLNFPPIFVFYERDSGAMLSCPPTNQSPEYNQVRRDWPMGWQSSQFSLLTTIPSTQILLLRGTNQLPRTHVITIIFSESFVIITEQVCLAHENQGVISTTQNIKLMSPSLYVQSSVQAPVSDLHTNYWLGREGWTQLKLHTDTVDSK